MSATEDLETKTKRMDVSDYAALVSDSYFQSKSFEQSGKLYESLGVNYIQKIVMGTGGVVFRKNDVDGFPTYFAGRNSSLEDFVRFEKSTRVFEALHLPLLVWSFNGLCGALAEENYGRAAGWCVPILINASCAMLQRYNRSRVERIIARHQERRALATK